MASVIATMLRLIPLRGTRSRSAGHLPTVRIGSADGPQSAVRNRSYINVVGPTQNYADVGKQRRGFPPLESGAVN
jgi:hypothetical protein